MPDVKFPTIDLDKAAADLNKAVRDAAYVAVGLGVIGFQKAQVQRVELSKQLEAQMAGLATFGEQLNGQAEPYIEAAQKQVADLRDQLTKLAGDLIPSEAPIDAATVRSQLTELAKSVDEALAPVRQQLEEQLDRLEEVLPQTARELVQTVRGAAAAQEQAVRSAVGL
ncbi:MAG: hypothetical protein M0Z30_06465 [Actinomycetota bacterium]|nr:hypothetical protein [Actinomycetota bacterium]